MTRELFKACCLHFLNKPYRWGGDDPIKGYDCSGFVQDLLAMIGLDPIGDQSAQALHDHFNRPAIGYENFVPQTGTLFFYGKSKTEITHVVLCLEPAIGLSGVTTTIGADGGGSRTLTEEDAATQNAFIKIRPANYRKDLVAVITPVGLPW